MKNGLPIKSWAQEDRPREKLLDKGPDQLSMAELLAILIGSGNKQQSAVSLSQQILSEASNDLDHLGKMTIHELMEYKGIGEAKAITIVAALELGRRRKVTLKTNKTKLNSSKAIFNHIQSKLMDKVVEECWVVYLNRALVCIGEEKIGIGGQAGVVIDPKVIFKKALDRRASSLVIIHNHPSDQLKPSHSDIIITNKLVEVGRSLELPITDHLIVGKSGFFSFRDEGLIG